MSEIKQFKTETKRLLNLMIRTENNDQFIDLLNQTLK